MSLRLEPDVERKAEAIRAGWGADMEAKRRRGNAAPSPALPRTHGVTPDGCAWRFRGRILSCTGNRIDQD